MTYLRDIPLNPCAMCYRESRHAAGDRWMTDLSDKSRFQHHAVVPVVDSLRVDYYQRHRRTMSASEKPRRLHADSLPCKSTLLHFALLPGTQGMAGGKEYHQK